MENRHLFNAIELLRRYAPIATDGGGQVKLAHVRRDQTPMLPAESVIRRWAAEESAGPDIKISERAVLLAWVFGTLIFVGYTLLIFNAGYGLGEESAFAACSSWRIRK